MTSTDVRGEHAAELTPSRRRRILLGSIAVVPLLLIGAGIGWWAYAAHYQPLSPGPSYGTSDPHVYAVTDGVHSDTAIVLDAPVGTLVQLGESISNDGPFTVRVQGVSGLNGLTATWFPGPGLTSDELDADGHPKAGRAFPATLAPGQFLTLVLHARVPDWCSPGAGETVFSGYDVTFESLGVHHVATVPFHVPVAVCGNAETRKHRVTP